MKRKLCDFCQKRSGSKRHREEESTQQHTKERDHIIQIWSAISGDLEHFVSIPTGKSLHTIADLRRAANESGGGYIDPDDDLICGIEIVDNEREISKLDKCTDVDYSTGERCSPQISVGFQARKQHKSNHMRGCIIICMYEFK